MKHIKSPIDIENVKSKVIECIPIRKYINNVLFKNRNSIYRNIVRLCSTKKNNSFNVRNEFNDFVIKPLYYKGGWPKEDSKGIIENLGYSLGKIVYYLKFFKFDVELQNELNKVGIKEIIIDESKFDSEFKLNNPTAEINKDLIIKEIYNLLQLQKEICINADTIKIDAYDDLPYNIKKNKDNPSGLDANTFSELVKKQLVNNKEKVRQTLNDKGTITKNIVDVKDSYYNNIIK